MLDTVSGDEVMVLAFDEVGDAASTICSVCTSLHGMIHALRPERRD
jgi:hypothetical protein